MAQERQHIRSLLKIFIFAAFAIELVGVIVATTLSYAEAHAMLGGEFLAGHGRLGSFAGESNRNALLVESTLPMVAYAMRTRPLPLVLARSEERRGGKECVHTCRHEWSQLPEKKKHKT